MNPIRPLLRSSIVGRSIATSSRSVQNVARRTLVTPTSPAQAKVSEVSLEQRVVEDPGEFEEGHHVAGEGASGEGVFSAMRLVELTAEMFGFKLNPVATKTGGQAKSQGRPIYLDMQVGQMNRHFAGSDLCTGDDTNGSTSAGQDVAPPDRTIR